MFDSSKFLSACSQTGKACHWDCVEEFHDDGELKSWDHLCLDCGNWRDWSKDEYPEDMSSEEYQDRFDNSKVIIIPLQEALGKNSK